MGLSRNKVAVPEGAAGTPPFWRILKGVPDAARPKLMRRSSKSGNTSFLERTIIQKLSEVWIGNPKASLLLMFIDIEKDEAECRNAGSLKPVL